uniref:Uncharacterized protein n=1 Tax=Leersia perrieri TaxID=77586 RepID=A0A0D9UZ39_9ORYZ
MADLGFGAHLLSSELPAAFGQMLRLRLRLHLHVLSPLSTAAARSSPRRHRPLAYSAARAGCALLVRRTARAPAAPPSDAALTRPATGRPRPPRC